MTNLPPQDPVAGALRSAGTFGRAFSIGLVAACVLVTAANVALIRQVRVLRGQLSLVAAQQLRSLTLHPGDRVTTMTGQDVSGRPLTIGYSSESRRTVLFVSSPRCTACADIWRKWNALLHKIDSTKFRALAVDVSSSTNSEFIARNHLERLIVVAAPAQSVIRNYKLNVTPQVVVVDAVGVVVGVWTGSASALGQEKATELARALEVARIDSRD